MAFIPDDCFPLMREKKLSPNARLVFEAHCKHRRHKYRVSFATNEEIADFLGISLGSVRNATTELKKKEWIKQVAHYTELLVGDFSPVDKKHPRREIPAGPLFRRPAHAASQPAHETVNPNHESVNGNHETVILHIEERAPVSSQSSQTSHTHTATPATRAREGDRGASRGKVCVCGLEVTLELLRRYARNQTPLLTEAWVGKAFDECFRHGQVLDWLERVHAAAEKPPALLNAKDCPDCGGTGVYYPEGFGKGVAKCPHAGLYARLAETAQARAHVAT
jgi:hypothetical protein